MDMRWPLSLLLVVVIGLAVLSALVGNWLTLVVFVALLAGLVGLGLYVAGLFDREQG